MSFKQFGPSLFRVFFSCAHICSTLSLSLFIFITERYLGAILPVWRGRLNSFAEAALNVYSSFFMDVFPFLYVQQFNVDCLPKQQITISLYTRHNSHEALRNIWDAHLGIRRSIFRQYFVIIAYGGRRHFRCY